jgi:hypothetical protein
MIRIVDALTLSGIASGNSNVDQGVRYIIVGVGIFLFIEVILFLGNKYGQAPTRGAGLGRIQAARMFRWVCPIIVLVGIVKLVLFTNGGSFQLGESPAGDSPLGVCWRRPSDTN